jgi:hypothetical protein
MLIPQYTIRWLLGLMTVWAVVFSIFAMALRGSRPAMAVSAGILMLVTAFLVYVGLFVLAWMISALTYERSPATAPADQEPSQSSEPPVEPIKLE